MDRDFIREPTRPALKTPPNAKIAFESKWMLNVASEQPGVSQESSAFIQKLRTRICEYFDE